MKKILGTIIVAVAFAAVSSVDAKQLKNRQQPTMSQSAANVANVAQDALNGQATGKDIIATVKQEAQTEEEAKTLALMAEIKDLENKKAALNNQIKDLKLSWFGFRNTADQKAAYNDFKEQLNVINGKLATAQSNLRLNRKEVSRSWYDVSVMALKAAIAVGVPVAVIADLYYGTGYTKAAYTEVRSGMPRTRAAAGRAYETGKGYAGRAYTGTKEYAGKAYETGKGYATGAYQYGKDTASSTYNRLPNMRRRAVDNTVNPVGPVTESYYNQQ